MESPSLGCRRPCVPRGVPTPRPYLTGLSNPVPEGVFILPLPLRLSCDRQPLHLGCFLSQNIGLSRYDRWKSVTQREAGSLKAMLPSKLKNRSRPHSPGFCAGRSGLAKCEMTLLGDRMFGGGGPRELAAPSTSLDGSRLRMGSQVLLGWEATGRGRRLGLSCCSVLLFLTRTPFSG